MQSRRDRQPPPTPGFTLIELLVVVAIIALLISILLPSLSRARQQAINVLCQTNIRQQLTATQLYANDTEGRLPFAKNLKENRKPYKELHFADFIQNALIPYLGGRRAEDLSIDPNALDLVAFSKVFRCPAVERSSGVKQQELKGWQHNHYFYNTHMAIAHPNKWGRPLSSVRFPARAVLFYDRVWADWLVDEFPHTTPRPGINVGYIDGHTSPMSAKDYLAANPYPKYEEEMNDPFIANGWDVYSLDPNEPETP